MQNVGQQYGHGGAPASHQTAPFGHTSEPTTNSNGSITSSLRQFRKDKQPLSDNHSATISESHVARVAPHNHFPPNRTNDLYRFPTSQYQDYGLPSQTKYSEVSAHQSLQEAPQTSTPSVIHKAKGGKEYMELGNVQPQMKQHYGEHHLNAQQNFNDANLHGQYLHKEAQVHPTFKSESQYFPKDQFAPHQVPPSHNLQKYNMPPQVNKYSTSNDFLSKLERINPSMARSIMTDHHLQEAAGPYRASGMDQRMYPGLPQNRRYPGGYGPPTSMQNNHYPPPHAFPPHMTAPHHPQAYQNYQASCSYNRGGGTAPHQMAGYPPSVLPPDHHGMSPRRGYAAENVGMMPVNYGMQQKMSPNYGHQYGPQEYAQHYQHRRLPMTTQDYYSQACRAQYLPHQMVSQEVPENRLTVSDNLKQYIENWADEETATEMQQIDSGTMVKENMRVRTDQSSETAVYMINASELQYLENLPVVTSENLVSSENGQYILKNGAPLDGMVRIVNKGSQMEVLGGTEDRVVNLHIMDSPKPSDCMMAAKPNEASQRPDGFYEVDTKPRVVVHQNTVIQTSYSKETEPSEAQKIGTSLPIITDEESAHPTTLFEEEINRSIIKESKRETVDKNCSPININEIQDYKDIVFPSVICPNKTQDFDIKNMPTIEELCEDALKSSEFDQKETLDEDRKKNESSVAEEKSIVEPGTLALGDSLDIQETRERSPTPIQDDGRSEFCVVEMKNLEESVMETENPTKPSEEGTEKAKEIEENGDTMLEHSEEKVTDVKNGPDVASILVKEIAASPSITESGNIKRKRRFFSVDDIINHIGNKAQKTRSDEEVKRRHSWQTNNDFLQKDSAFKINFTKLKAEKEKTDNLEDQSVDVEHQSMDVSKMKEHDSKENATIQIKKEDRTDESKGECELKTEVSVEKNNKPESKDESSENKNDSKASTDASLDNSVNTSSLGSKEISEQDTTNVSRHSLFEDSHQDDLEDNKELSDIPDDPLDLDTNSVISFQKSDISDHKDDSVSQPNDESRSAQGCCKNLVPTKAVIESSTVDSNEVLYRNIIKVEESSILLQIAGELVEINVNNINGKKVITVVSLSNSTVVDFNDNYESVDNTERDPLKIDDIVTESNDQSNDIMMQPEFVEPTSEIIIGMDLSLEEEIHLDIEQPKVLCTKAAKKAYEYDLQIPSITTSEDVYDNTKSQNYINDKVSSSREHSSSKTKKSSKKEHKKSSSKHKEKHDKKVKREVLAHQEEFVLFSDLVKARKLKKLKMKEKMKEDAGKVDSTNVEGDVTDSQLTEEKRKKSKEGGNMKVIITENSKVAQPTSEKPKLDSLIVNLPLQKKEDVCSKESVELNELKESKVAVEKSTEQICLAEKPLEKSKEQILLVQPNQQSLETALEKSIEATIVTKTTEQSLEKENLSLRKDDNPGNEEGNSISKSNAVDTVGAINEEKTEALDVAVKPKAVVDGKRKLSLEEYINRKRRLLEKKETEPPVKAVEEKPKPKEEVSKLPKPERIKFPRPKSLDEVGQQPARENVKRKFSLQENLRPPSFDWEETQSPKIHQIENRRFSEFRGLINDTKIKNSSFSESGSSSSVNTSEDQILHKYKVQVESKLSSLNLQIPKIVKPTPTVSNPKNLTLVQRFLRDEKLTLDEIDKIKKIIEYKRVAQKLTSPISKTAEEMAPAVKQPPTKKKKKRFRNLYAESTSESEEEPQSKKNVSDYSVVQSNCLAGVVPKLIIKRKTEFPVPIVRLERLDLGLLIDKKRKYPD